MYCLKFLLRGKHAFFKYPNFNIINFTYSHIHKPALLGLLGAIVGYNGYRSISEDDVYPEYYKKLKNLKISIVPKSERFIKTYYTFNNTSGTACNTKRIENLVTTFQILENVQWDIYILDDGSNVYNILKNRMLMSESVFTPYLGNNSFLATIENVEIINIEDLNKSEGRIISLVEEDNISIREAKEDMLLQNINEYFYVFSLPKELDNDLLYKTSEYILTNKKVNIINNRNYFKAYGENILYFF